jgi:leader peptidase (prepilin peptidase)/N-methyltransferase
VTVPPWPALLLGVFGLIVGSFLNVCIHRLPRGESLIRPRSYCPRCRTPIRWADNIPVLSYLWLGGRCRACGTSIPLRYPLVELATMGTFVAHYAVLGWQPVLAVRLVFAAALIVLFVIDLEHRLLPNRITLPGMVVGVAASMVAGPGWRSSLGGLLLGGGLLWAVGEVYVRWRHEEGLGMGDVKMLAMVGAFLGWPQVLVTLMVGSLVGSLVGLGVIATGRGTMKSALPYGTFLALGAMVASLAGDAVVAWYVGLYR